MSSERHAEPGGTATRGPLAGLLAPILVGLLFLALWEGAVRLYEVKHYVLPGPVLILKTLIQDKLGLALREDTHISDLAEKRRQEGRYRS